MSRTTTHLSTVLQDDGLRCVGLPATGGLEIQQADRDSGITRAGHLETRPLGEAERTAEPKGWPSRSPGGNNKDADAGEAPHMLIVMDRRQPVIAGSRLSTLYGLPDGATLH